MSLLDFLAAILACSQVVEVWNHGSIFATRRAKLALSDSWLASLLRCMFCLSIWVGWLAALSVLAANLLPDLYACPIRLFGYGLAISRAANLLNDLTHDWSRTPKTLDSDWDESYDSDDPT